MDSMYDSTALFLSIVSGFLLVAYLAGAKLTQAQAVIISTLFVVGAGLQCWALVSHELAIEEYLAAKAEISPLTAHQLSIAQGNAGTIIAIAVVAGIVAALYFMWSVRHPKTE
jgi:small-conductance mechanosensitive channel